MCACQNSFLGALSKQELVLMNNMQGLLPQIKVPSSCGAWKGLTQSTVPLFHSECAQG